MCRTGGPRCNGSKKTPEPAPVDLAGYETFPTVEDYHEAKLGVVAEPQAEPDLLDALFTLPGTGSDWRNAKCPEGMVPDPPATLKMRPWNKIGARSVPTDREQLRYYDEMSQGDMTGSTVHAQLAADSIRARARAGRHDGSLPEFGDYTPTYFTYKEDQK